MLLPDRFPSAVYAGAWWPPICARPNRAEYNIGQFVGAGVLPESEAFQRVMDAASDYAREDGETQTRMTIMSGLNAGKKQPRDLSHVNGNGHIRIVTGDEGAIGPTEEDKENSPILNRHEEWKCCVHNSVLWIRRKGITVKLDTFRQTVYVDGNPVTDELVATLSRKIETAERIPWRESAVWSAIADLSSQNSYSSLVDYLDPLEWDGVARIDHFFSDCFGSEHSEYSAACARVFFLSAVARAFHPGCKADVMPVLMGPQGIGKSTGMALLCPERDWFCDDLGGDLHSKDAAEALREKWLIEFGEFARINRSTSDVYKAFLSRQVDHYRPAYGRVSKDFPRQCAFFGTTNSETPLQDVENRRFMPLKVVQANFKLIEENRDQLWAESVHRFKQGEQWWVTDTKVVTVIRERQEEARNADAWETLLGESLGHYNEITIDDVMTTLAINKDRLDKSTQTRVGLCLSKIGFERKQRRKEGQRGYCWLKKP